MIENRLIKQESVGITKQELQRSWKKDKRRLVEAAHMWRNQIDTGIGKPKVDVCEVGKKDQRRLVRAAYAQRSQISTGSRNQKMD